MLRRCDWIVEAIALSTKGEIVECRDAIGLRPHTDRAGPMNVVIFQGDIYLAVEGHFYFFTREVCSEGVPLAESNGRIDVFDRDAAAALRVIERDVILQGVGTSNVVIIAILPAPDQSTGGIFLSADRLEFYLDEAVGNGRVFFDAPWEGAAAGLFEHIGRA